MSFYKKPWWMPSSFWIMRQLELDRVYFLIKVELLTGPGPLTFGSLVRDTQCKPSDVRIVLDAMFLAGVADQTTNQRGQVAYALAP